MLGSVPVDLPRPVCLYRLLSADFYLSLIRSACLRRVLPNSNRPCLPPPV
jgi:hypothetical protein